MKIVRRSKYRQRHLFHNYFHKQHELNIWIKKKINHLWQTYFWNKGGLKLFHFQEYGPLSSCVVGCMYKQGGAQVGHHSLSLEAVCFLKPEFRLVSSLQARSQDPIWWGAEPPKSGPFSPKKVDFLNLTPPQPSYKIPIFGPLCDKKWTFCQIWWGASHPPGYMYGPGSFAIH